MDKSTITNRRIETVLRPGMIALIFSAWLLCGGAAFSQTVDPWEVILYENPNYAGQSVHYKMEPGMRYRLVKLIDLEDRVSSIKVGSKVVLLAFGIRNFIADIDQEALFRGSISDLTNTRHLDHNISSIIMMPDVGSTLEDGFSIFGGVVLWDLRAAWDGDYGQHKTYLPLPEYENQTEATYPTLGWADLDRNANGIKFHAKNVEVTLYHMPNFVGTSIKFPPEGPEDGFFQTNLGDYEWSDRASSLKIEWIGPPLNLGPPGPSGQQTTTIPAPPSLQIEYGINLPGSDYKSMAMNGDSGECAKACAQDAQCMAFTWVKPGAQGESAACWLKTSVPAAALDDTNCVSGYKGTKPPVQKSGQLISNSEPVVNLGTPIKSGFKNPVPAAPQSPTASGVKGAMPAQQGPYEYGVNLPGGDLKGLFMDGGPEECEKACNAEAQCLAFTWVKPGVQGPKAACWLKKSPVPAPQPFPDAVSGYKKTAPAKPPGG